MMGLVFTIILTLFASKNANILSQAFYSNSSINVLLMSVAVFIWFKYNAKGNKRLNKIIPKLSQHSFGAFLVHVFILEFLKAVGFSCETLHPVLAVPAITIFTIVASYLISLLLNKIPVIKKYLV